MATLDQGLAPEMLVGLAPTASGACPRCGRDTRALANGRSRIDICGGCGTVDVQSREGLDVWSLRGATAAPRAPLPKRGDPRTWRLD